jgi:hypothetical protein
MRLRPPLRAFAIAFFLGGLGLASSARGAMDDPQTSSPMPPGVAESLNDLADQPATHMGYTLDRSEMQLARSVLESGGVDSARAAAALTSLSFDTYRYKAAVFYTPETMASIVDAYHRAGWKHMVNGNQAPANATQPRTAITDLWLHFSGADIDHVTVMIRSARDLNLIQIGGDLRPLDLLHLSGHFGIPKVDPNAIMVPAPEGR